MKFADVERVLDIARSDRERISFLESVLPRLRGESLRSALIALANAYALQKKFRRAAEVYELVGMNDDAAKARSRIRVG